MRFCSLIFVLGWLGGSAAVAQDGPDRPQVLYVLRVFTLPKTEGLDLLAKDLDDRALHQVLADKVKTTPGVLEQLILVADNGAGDVELQQANEFIYPTEFDPQQLPTQVAIGDAALVEAVGKFFTPPAPPAPTPMPPPPDTQQKQAPEFKAPLPAPAKPRHPVNLGLGLITAITPTAFHMRPLGERLTVTSGDISLTGEMNLTLVYESTEFAGFQTFNGEPQPQFRSRHLSSVVTSSANEPCFLGTCTKAQGTGTAFETKETTVSLAFLTARVLPLPANPPLAALGESPQLSAVFEVISVAKNEAAGLVDEALEDGVFHGRLRSGLKAGSARLEAFLGGPLADGASSTLEEADEYIYPTEFDPPQIPTSILIADGTLLADLRAGRQVGTGISPPDANAHNGGFGLMTSATPTAFKTRKLGASLEVSATRQGQWVALTVKPQLTRKIGERRYNGTIHPLFESQFLSTTTTTRLGMPRLLGTLSRPINTGVEEGNTEDRIWFAFVTVRVSR